MKTASVIIAYQVSENPYKVEARSYFYGPARDAGLKLIQALKQARKEPNALTVTICDHATDQHCHIDIKHSLIFHGEEVRP